MDRREFLSTASAATAASLLGAGPAAMAAEPATQPATQPAAFRLDSPPVLQCPTADGVTVCWAVNGPSAGWVEYGPTEKLGRLAYSADRGLVAYESRYHMVRVPGVRAGDKLFYRVVAAPITFQSAYKIIRGEPVASAVYEYTPPNPGAATGTFAVINDTHEKIPTLAAVTADLAKSPADVTVWNGDVFDDIRTSQQIVQNVLRPAGVAYAARQPVLFSAGNHDHRGVLARELSRAFAPWPNNWALPWNYAVRVGPIALVGLDTGEDKPDEHPTWAGLSAFGPYRRMQAAWLAETLRRADIASAPHLVVCCHIPLRDDSPKANGGDTLTGFADYCKNGQDLWSGLLQDAKAAVVISGHTHRHRYDAPNAAFRFGQLVGGGPKLESATVIRGSADARQLTLTATTAADGKEIGCWTFAARS